VTWVGKYGYWPTGLKHTEFYMLDRHDSDVDGRWTTIDNQWPVEQAYTYVDNSPCLVIDPTGEGGCQTRKPRKPAKPRRKVPPKAKHHRKGKVRRGPIHTRSSPPDKTKHHKSKCNNSACDQMCDWLANNWAITGVPANFGASCALCCSSLFGQTPEQREDCLINCGTIVDRGNASGQPVSGSSSLLPCSCPDV